MSAARRHAAAALDDGERAVRQPARGLALPVELQRGGADDDRRERAVGLERRERLDGLAEALLVGEERAARVEHVADARPLERLELPPSTRGDLGDRLALVARELRMRLAPRRARRAGGERGAARCRATSHLVQRDERVELLDDPRVERHRALGLRGGQALERGAGVRVPEHLDLQAVARRRRSTTASRAGGGSSPSSSASMQRSAAASMRADGSSRSASRVRRASSARACGRPCSTAPVGERLGDRPGARAQRPPAAAVVAERADAADPAALDAGEPVATSALGTRSGKRSRTSATCTRAPVVDGRPPLARGPSRTAAAGSRAPRRRCARRTGTRARRSPRAPPTAAARRSGDRGRAPRGRTVEGGAARAPRLAGQPGRFATFPA